MATTPTGSSLQVLKAVEDGWNAFCKAPWSFLLFQFLGFVVSLPFIGIALLGSSAFSEKVAWLNPILGFLLVVVGVISLIIVWLWTWVGLLQGAWTALEGHKPDFAVFTRWNKLASLRLAASQILCLLISAVAASIAYLAGKGLFQINQSLIWIPWVAFAILWIWFHVSQAFIFQASLLGSKNPIKAVGSGINIISPSWWNVLWLLIVQFGVIYIVIITTYITGLWSAAPFLLCISTAAYRQLFGSTDNTGLLKPN